MAKKPSYIGTLNAIANGERGGYELFKAWCDATDDARLRESLNQVAVREMEHSWAFEKRLTELGFTLRPQPKSTGFRKQLKLLKSKASDTEKFASFGIGVERKRSSAEPRPDGLLQILADQTIDPVTGGLIGRYICEERDSGELLKRAFKAMQRRQVRAAA